MHTLILSIIQIMLAVTAITLSICIIFPCSSFFGIYNGRNYNQRRKPEQESKLSDPPHLDSIK